MIVGFGIVGIVVVDLCLDWICFRIGNGNDIYFGFIVVMVVYIIFIFCKFSVKVDMGWVGVVFFVDVLVVFCKFFGRLIGKGIFELNLCW